MNKNPQRTSIPPDLEQELLARWPTLPATEHSLWLRVLGALLPPDAHVLMQLKQQHDELLLERQQREYQRIQNQGAIQLLESWIAEDTAMTPVQQEAALAEWEQFQRLLDEEYLADTPLQP